jgi:molybdopterin synthase sulfur carrier subunit
MALVRIPASLRSFTGNKGEVVVQGATVAEVLDNLEPTYPGLRARIVDEKGALRRYVNVFHNEEDIRFAQDLATLVKDGDRLTIVPAIAGGEGMRC